MKIEPYLNFGGRAAEAIAFYQSAVAAKVTMTLTFDESPDKNHPTPLPPNWGNKIMHCGLMIGETLLMLSDCGDANPVTYSGISLSLNADSEAHAKKLFDALSAGGSVMMPLGKTFWSPCFGMCADKFGVNWMVGFEGEVK